MAVSSSCTQSLTVLPVAKMLIADLSAYLQHAMSELPWGLSGPTPERMRERANLLISQQPRDFGDGQFPVQKVALRQSGPQFIQYIREYQALPMELARKRSRADAKPPRYFRCTGFSVGQQLRQYVFHDGTETPPLQGPTREGFLCIPPQQVVQKIVTLDYRQRRHLRGKDDLVSVRIKLDIGPEECPELRWCSISPVFYPYVARCHTAVRNLPADAHQRHQQELDLMPV